MTAAMRTAWLCVLICNASALGVVASQPGYVTLRGTVSAPGARTVGLHVTLNGGERGTTTTSDGSFSIPAVAPGVYLLEIEAAPLPAREPGGLQTHALVFSTYKVQVTADDAGGASIAVLEYRYPGAPKLPSRHPIDAVAVAPAAYFEERPRPSVWSLLSNPTVLMIVVMGGLVFVMPMMMVRGVADVLPPQ